MARSVLLPMLLKSHRQLDGGNCGRGRLDFPQLKPSGKSVGTNLVYLTHMSLTPEFRALQSGKDCYRGKKAKVV